MKVLQVNCVYNSGSTGKIVSDIHMGLQAKGIESIVCYGRGTKVSEPNVYKISSEFFAKANALRARVTGFQYNGSWIATNKLIGIIRKERPDIVHLHCINGYFVNIYRLFEFLKKNKIRTVLTLHAEFMHTGSCGHSYECNKWMTGCGNCPQLWKATSSYFFDHTHSAWIMMKKAFEAFDTLHVVAVSSWLGDRARQSPIMEGCKFGVIWNGIDTRETFRPRNFEYLRKKHGLKDEKVLLHVTAKFSLQEDDWKGGRYVVQLADRLKGENVKIIVIGGRDLSIVLPNNVLNVGRVNNQKELAAYYSMADLTILTSKRETFSMVCAESLSCGTPVVGFKAGGPEQISLPNYSEFVEYGDVDDLMLAVSRFLSTKDYFHGRVVQQANNMYSIEEMCTQYIKLYTD